MNDLQKGAQYTTLSPPIQNILGLNFNLFLGEVTFLLVES